MDSTVHGAIDPLPASRVRNDLGLVYFYGGVQS